MNSQQEHSNLSRRETERPERTNNAIPSPFGGAPLNSRVGAYNMNRIQSQQKIFRNIRTYFLLDAFEHKKVCVAIPINYI